MLNFFNNRFNKTCDNDCVTDDEQIKGAVRTLYKSIVTHLKEESKAEMLLPPQDE